MSNFINQTIAGGLTGLLIVGIIAALGGANKESVGVAYALLLFVTIFIAHDWYMTMGLLISLLIIWAVWAAKKLRKQK